MASGSGIEAVARSPIFVLCTLIADIAAVVALLTLDPVQRFVQRNPFLFYAATIILIGLLVVSIFAVARLRSIKQEKQELVAQLEKEKLGLISDFERRLYPTARDKALLEELLTTFPHNSGFMPYLDHRFIAKTWRDEDIKPLGSFLWKHEQSFFDDPGIQRAFAAFHAACRDLDNWMTAEGFASDTDLQLYIIKRGDEREGGWKERDQAMRIGLDLARNVLRTRVELEKVGRARGL